MNNEQKRELSLALMHECLARGINPEPPAAPQTIRDAVARFFEEGRATASHGLPASRSAKLWKEHKEFKTRVLAVARILNCAR